MPQEHEGLSPKDLQMIKAFASTFAEVTAKDKITPEIMAAIIKEANKPYVDEAAVQREQRERAKARRDFLEAKKVTEAQQKACPHKDKDGKNAINLQHNFPDGQPRGNCPLCLSYIQPTHWEIGPPNMEHPEGVAHLVQEHPLYYMVREKESMS